MMARNQFMKDSCAREMRIVTAHAHHLLLVRHGVSWIRNENCFAAEEERTYELALGRHHFHAPGVASELGHRHEIVIVDELDGFEREVANHLGLFARLDVRVLYMLKRFLPFVAVA